LSTIIFFSKQSFFEQKEICGRWENPHNFYVVESAKGVGYFLGSLTHWLAVLKSTVMKGNKIKVEHGVALLPLPVVGKIPFLLNQ